LLARGLLPFFIQIKGRLLFEAISPKENFGSFYSTNFYDRKNSFNKKVHKSKILADFTESFTTFVLSFAS